MFTAPRARAATPAGMLAAALLAGCAAPPAPVGGGQLYAPPSGVPTARLVMRGRSLAEGQIFGVIVHSDPDHCKGPRLAGAGNPARNPATVALAAGTLATVDFVVRRGTSAGKPEWCRVRWSFVPAAGRSYLLAGGPLAASCAAALVDATDPDAMRPVAGAVRRDAACAPVGPAVAAGGQNDGAAVLNPGATDKDLEGLIGK